MSQTPHCSCDRLYPRIRTTELNDIRLNLLTVRNQDGTRFLQLVGKDIEDRFGQRIRDTDIPAIGRHIRHNRHSIVKLHLCYNKITDVGFRILLKQCLINGNSSLLHLDIMNNRLTDRSMKKLAKYASRIKLHSLRLCGNHFGPKSGEYFGNFLLNNKSVTTTDIAQSDQNLTSLAPIVGALREQYGGNTTVKILDLSRIIPNFNRYNLESKWIAYQVDNLLKDNQHIEQLDLEKNEFLPHDAELIVHGLLNNQVLRYLNLANNKLGDYGAEMISSFLKTRPMLESLNLRANDIGDLGARDLCIGLPLSKVVCIDLSRNRLTSVGVMDILMTLKKYVFMKRVHLWGNEFNNETCQVICRLLRSGTLFQEGVDFKIYEVDGVLFAAEYKPSYTSSKNDYYCVKKYAEAQPINHIERKVKLFRTKFNVDLRRMKNLRYMNPVNTKQLSETPLA